MPLFSIITPVYNGERYIKNTLDSVLSQEFKDYEYIIVNDGSTDGTLDILKEYRKKDIRIKIVDQSNQWIFNAMNNGCKVATGEYIFFINADDLMCEHTLKRAEELIKKYNPDVIWTRINACRCNENQEILEEDILNYARYTWEEKFFKDADEVHKNWLWLYQREYTQNNVNFYRRNLLLEYPFRNDFYGADTYLNPHMANAINSAVTMVEPVIMFMDYNSDSMNTSGDKYYGYEFEMYHAIMDEHIARLQEWNVFDEEAKQYLYKRALREISYCMRLLNTSRCKLSLEEKLEVIVNKYFGDKMYKIANEIGATEELESRVLSGIRTILLREQITKESKWYFLYKLLDILLRYEKTQDDKKIVENAINNSLNKNHLGKTFYEKLGDEAWSF